MKKIVLILGLLILALAGMLPAAGQGFPNTQPIGSPATSQNNKGGQNALSYVAGNFADTTAANVNPYIKTIPGNIIRTGGENYWVRNKTATGWITIGNINSNTSITTITNLGDTAVILCDGAGHCDTISISPTITNIVTVYFSSDTTIVVCNTSTCETIPIPQQNLYVFQNGLIQIAPGIAEWGGNKLLHPTTVDMNGVNVDFTQRLTGTFSITQLNAGHDALFSLNNPSSVAMSLKGNGEIRVANTDLTLAGYNDLINLKAPFYGGVYVNPGRDSTSNFGVNAVDVDTALKIDAVTGEARLGAYPDTRNDGVFRTFLTTDNQGNLKMGSAAPNTDCGLQSGGLVTYDSTDATGHQYYDVSPAIYCINNNEYQTVQTRLTVTPADSLLPRQTAFYVDTLDLANFVDGDTAVNPEVPQIDPVSQLFLTSVLINALDSIPSGFLLTTIYDEGIAEWDTATTGTANFRGTVNPAHLTHAIDVGPFTTGKTWTFTVPSGGTVDLSNYTTLKLYVRLKSAFANGVRLSFQWMINNTVLNTNNISIGGNGSLYNFVRTTVGAYQVITINIPAWRVTSTITNRLRIRAQGANAQGFYLDWIQLQGGIPQGGGGGNPGTVTNVTVTGNAVITPVVNDPTGNVNVALNLANACAYCTLRNPTASPAAPSYGTLDLSTPIFTGLLDPVKISPNGVEGSFLQIISGVPTFTALPTGYDTTFVFPPIFVRPGVNNDTIGLHLFGSSSVHVDSTTAGMTLTAIETLQQVFNTEPGGSVLTKIDSILPGAFTLKVLTTTSNDNPFFVSATTGSGIVSNTTSGNAVFGTATTGVGGQFNTTSGSAALQAFSSTGVALTISNQPAATNTVVPVMNIQRGTIGTAANGIGGSEDFYVQTSDGTTRLSNQIVSKLTNATTGSRTSQLTFTGVNGATTQPLAIFEGSGFLTLPQYIPANFNGGTSSDSVLVVNSSGFVLKRNGADFGGGTFNTAFNGLTAVSGDSIKLGGTLTENTTILATSKWLQILDNSNFSSLGAVGRFFVSSSGLNGGSSSTLARFLMREPGNVGFERALDVETTGASENTGITVNIHGVGAIKNTGILIHADSATVNYGLIVQTGAVGIGTLTPDSLFQVNGSLKFVTGRQQAGYVLTSDANGGADWAPGGGGGSGINLYNTDSVLAGPRTVGMNDQILDFTQSEFDFLLDAPERVISGQVQFGNSFSSFHISSSPTSPNFDLASGVTNGLSEMKGTPSGVIISQAGSGQYGLLDVRDAGGNPFFEVTIGSINENTSAIDVSGTGYTVDDVLTVSGGTYSAMLVVDGVDSVGGILAFHLIYDGAGYDIGNSIAALTGGTGADATIAINSFRGVGVNGSPEDLFDVYDDAANPMIQAGANGTFIQMQVQNTTGAGLFTISANSDQGYGFQFYSSDGVPDVPSISLTANATQSSIVYNAKTQLLQAMGLVVSGNSDAHPRALFDVQKLSGETTMFSVADGGVYNVAINDGGSGYVEQDVVSFTAGNSDSRIIVTGVDGGGAITSFTVTSIGSGYFTTTAGPTSAVSGTGTGATFDYSAATGVTVGGLSEGLLFNVTDGDSNLLTINNVSFTSRMKATDATVSAGLLLEADGAGNNIAFDLSADNNVNPPIRLKGDAFAHTITLTAPNSNFVGNTNVTGDPEFSTGNAYNWGSTTFSASGDLPNTALIGSNADNVTFFPSFGSVTVGKKLTLGYWSGSARSAFEVTNVASGDGQAVLMKTGGNVTIGGSFNLPYAAKTTTYAITANDYTVDCTTGTFTTTLPTAVGVTGRVYVVKNSGAGIITIATTSSQTIDGSTTKTVATGVSIMLQSTGTNWIIL